MIKPFVFICCNLASLRQIATDENERFNHRLLRLANHVGTSFREIRFEARSVRTIRNNSRIEKQDVLVNSESGSQAARQRRTESYFEIFT